jgi:hypothetical protein
MLKMNMPAILEGGNLMSEDEFFLFCQRTCMSGFCDQSAV